MIRSFVYCSMASISSMPSASLISSNQPPSSGNLVQPTSEKSMAAPVIDTNLCGEGPLGQALQVVEKKVRNLEKRKVSLLEDHHKEENSTLHHAVVLVALIEKTFLSILLYRLKLSITICIKT